MRSRGDLKVAVPKDYVEDGDYVVPQYNEMGRQLEDAVIIGSEKKLSKMALSIARHASNHGGAIATPVVVAEPAKPVKGKKGKKQAVAPQPVKAKKPTVVDPAEPAVVVKPGVKFSSDIADHNLAVTFQNKFGKIKMKALDSMDSELAICLIFKNEDALSFIPEQGEELFVTIGDAAKERVLFPGAIFTWPDREKQLMVLFRSPADE
jgi:hypothetical protein